MLSNSMVHKLFSVKDLEQVQSRIGRKYWFYKGDELYRYRLSETNGPYQTRNLQMLRKCVPNARTIIDVGANIGTNTVEYATWGKNIESFEPMRNNFYLCKKNVAHAKKHKLKGTYFDRKSGKHKHNPDRPDGWFKTGKKEFSSLDLTGKINFYNVALGDKATQVNMAQKISEYSRGDAVMVNGKSKHPKTKVKMDTLDSYDFKDVDIIKIDVEGFELRVLQGATNTIKKHRPVIQCELRNAFCKRFGYTANDLVKFVKSFRSYVMCDFNGKICTSDVLQKPNNTMDVFFVPKKLYNKLETTNKSYIGRKVTNKFTDFFE